MWKKLVVKFTTMEWSNLISPHPYHQHYNEIWCTDVPPGARQSLRDRRVERRSGAYIRTDKGKYIRQST